MAAYAYFDENGNLLEFISDRTLRQGNSEGVNKIYVYMEPEDFNYADKSLRCTYKDINTNAIYDTTIGSILDHIVSKSLPTFKDYDPTHFVSGKIYPFIEITVPGAVMELEGSKVLSLAMDQLVEDTEADPQYEPYLIYQSVITFYVNESVIQYTETISKSQYDYLLSLIGSVDAKIYDKSKTIFKVANRTELGSASQWSDGQVLLVISDGEYSNHMTLLMKEDNSYPLLYDFNDHYTKSEVDGFITTLTTAINGKSTVSGTTDAQGFWYTLTIDGVTHRIGGSGGGATYEAGYGILIDSANHVIAADLGVLATKLDLESYATTSSVSALSGRVSTIEGLIPAQATSENQLADKNFVNSSIATNTANFIGTFANVTALNNYSGTVTNNDYANVINQELDFSTTIEMNAYSKALLTNYDYAWVVNGAKYDLYRFDIETQTWGLRATNIAKTDVSLITVYNRYTYNSGLSQWKWNYSINTSGFTAAQWAAINSGITSGILSGLARESELADAYSSSATYAVGDYCIYNNTLYRCTTAVSTAESFDSNKWTAVKIADVMVDKSSPQTITGTKTFSDSIIANQANGIIFGSAGFYSIKKPSGNDLHITTYGGIKIKNHNQNSEFDLSPYITEKGYLGSYSNKWKDLHLAGKILDGTYSVSVAGIYNGTFNVINASDIQNSAFDTNQRAIINNGRPTRIVGTFLGITNGILSCNSALTASTYIYVFEGSIGSGEHKKCLLGVNQNNGNYALRNDLLIVLSNIETINGKEMDYYLNNVYPYASNATTELKYETINNISISADTTYTLATAPSGTYPEYKGYITNSDASNSVTITLTGISKIKCNNGNIVIVEATNSTVTIPASKTLQFKIQNGKATFFDWDAPWADAESIKTQSTGGATSIQLKTWVGTQAQYDSILTKDANTQYIII